MTSMISTIFGSTRKDIGDDHMGAKTSNEVNTKATNGCIRSIFMQADRVDMALMFFGLLGAIIGGFSARMTLLIFANILNNIGSNEYNLNDDSLRRDMINKNTLAMLYCACGIWLCSFLEGYCWTRTGERQAARTRVAYMKAVLRQDVGYFDLHASTTSEVTTTISMDILLIQDVLSEKVPNFLARISRFVGSFAVAFILLWKLALVAVPLTLFLFITVWFCGRSLKNLSGKIREEYNKAGIIAEQAISSIRTVYAFGGEEKTIGKFSEALHVNTKLGLKLGLVKGIAIGTSCISFAIWSVMAYYGSRLVMYHGAQGGTAFVVGSSIVNAAMDLGACLSNLKDLMEAFIASKHINEMIKRVPKIDLENMEGEILDDVHGVVEFKHVKFAYPSRPESIVCKNLCLTIPAGKTTALVGVSGSGKSTLLSLLQRFYDPIEGEILLDGVAIDMLQLKWLRSQMAMVSQEPSLFSTTIKENILFGNEDATMEDVIEAAIACNIHSFIKELPQGYDSQVGERGVQLSGGQKQRIAIAQAIIRKPRILLLDEATSALDYESERVVQEALDRVVIGRTTIIIAHRLSTIKGADNIALLKDGQVMEIGSHDELIEHPNGLYTSLIHQQKIQDEQTSKECFHASSLTDFESNKTNIHCLSKETIPLGETSLTLANALDEDPKVVRSPFWRLLVLNMSEWKQAFMGCLSAILFGAVQPIYSFVMGAMMSVYFLTDQDEIKEKTRAYALLFVGLSLFSMMISITQHYNFAYMGEFLTKRVRERLLSKILTFEVGWFDTNENSSGIICSRLSKDANMVKSLVGDRMSLLLQSFVAVTIAWTMGLVIAWRLALVVIATQPLIIICIYTKRVLLKTMAKKAIKAQDESCKLASEAVFNLRTITAFSSQDRILKMLENAQDGPRRESIRQSWVAGVALACAESIIICIRSLNFWYGGNLVFNGYLTARAVFQTVLILTTTGRVIADAGSMTTDLAKGFDAIGLVFSILDRDTRINPENPNGKEPENIEGNIELHDVHFAYPARPKVMVFQGFSFKFEAGKSTALVGQSGCGKSTIIGLIERFYDPQKGLVKIDGHDIRSYNLRSIRKHIALVSQEPILFSGTIRENIAYGASKEFSEIEIIEAAKVANAHDFIAAFKNGYDTWCGDRGIQLSGGQKQRIAIARAVLRSPSVLLLDEATSALDSESEKVVQDALNRTVIGRTSVVVAHRLCTIKECDLIVVLDKGKVVENGTHSSLMAKGSLGAYFSLLNLDKTKRTAHN